MTRTVIDWRGLPAWRQRVCERVTIWLARLLGASVTFTQEAGDE